MKLSRRSITRTDAITVGLGTVVGAALGGLFGALNGGTPAAVGFAFLFSISGALAGTLICFARKPGNRSMSPERITLGLFTLAALMLTAGVVEHFAGRSGKSSVTAGSLFAILGFIGLASKRKKRTTPIKRVN